MALNDILTSMDGARDALVTAINAKGGSLAQDSTLYQCADAVGSLSGGTSAEYYKCASVTPGVSGAVIEVTGDTAYGCNGTYTIVDATATGKNRTWRTSDGVWEIRNIKATLGLDKWRIYDVASDTCKIDQYMSGTVPDNPWEVPAWQNNTSPYAYPDLVLTPTDSTNTWSGYKAVFNPTDGTWSFEDTVTEGLSYIGITPVVGKIYSADTTIQVGYIKLDGILNDETVKFLLYPKLNGTLEDVSTGGNGVTVTNTGSVAVENDRIVFGEGKALTIPANTLPDDIFVAGKPFLIEFQGIIPAYTSKTCGAFARKEGSMYYDRLDMYLNTIEGDSNYGQMTIGYWTNNVTVPVGAFTVGAEHVVAFEYDGNNTSRVYLDGVMQYSFTGTDYLPFRTYDFLIGHDTDEIGGSNGNPFQGNMSYFRIRNVAPYLGSNYTPEWV